MIIHPTKGKITKKGTKYNPIGNKVEDLYMDEQGNEHALDGTEKTDGMIMDESKIIRKKSESFEEKEFEKLASQMKEAEQISKEKQEKEEFSKDKEKRHRDMLESQKNASEAIVEAVRGIPETIIPKFTDHIDEQRKWKDEVVKTIKGLKFPETDLKPVIEAIENIKFPEITETKIPKPIDYTSLLEEIKKTLPKEVDFTPVLEAIRNIPQFKIPERLIYKDHLKVAPDRVGSGGGAIPQGALDNISNIASTVSDGHLQVDVNDQIAGSSYDTTEIDTSDPNNIVINYKLDSNIVATETVEKSGSIISIIKS